MIWRSPPHFDWPVSVADELLLTCISFHVSNNGIRSVIAIATNFGILLLKIAVGGKTTFPVLALFLVEYFIYSQVGAIRWWKLLEAIKIPSEMRVALFLLCTSSTWCYVTEWPKGDVAQILIYFWKGECFCRAPLLISTRMITSCMGQF